MTPAPLIQLGYGMVMARAGASPGPASGITYTVRYVTNEGDLPDAPGQVPTTRWTATDVVAHPVEFTFAIVVVGETVISMMPPEPPHVTECGQ